MRWEKSGREVNKEEIVFPVISEDKAPADHILVLVFVLFLGSPGWLLSFVVGVGLGGVDVSWDASTRTGVTRASSSSSSSSSVTVRSVFIVVVAGKCGNVTAVMPEVKRK